MQERIQVVNDTREAKGKEGPFPVVMPEESSFEHLIQ